MLDRRKFLGVGFKGIAGSALLLGLPAVHARTMEGAPVELKTAAGALRGRQSGEVTRFLGIPFAQPPVGALRFMAPQPAAPWEGVRDALEFGKSAIQTPMPAKYVPVAAQYDEDCLYLNVWAPKTPGPHPVYVYIYGGGNTGGTTSMPVFDGENLARKGIVTVSIAYRVGVFGFLDVSALLGDAYAGSGNNGLRDQIMALRWIRENITAFGGDPRRVTIGGQSAGAKNVISLLAAPAAKGLFQRAISESGGAHTYATQEMAHDLAERVLETAGLERAQAAQLKTLPARDLLAIQGKVIANYPLRYPFRAVVDKVVLPLAPIQAIRNGMARDIPILMGTTRDEQAMFGPAKTMDGSIESREMANIDFAAFNRIFAKYKKTLPDLNDAQLRYRALNAESYWIPTIRMAEAQALAGGASWVYRLDMPMAEGERKGYAVHGSELALVFDNLQDSTAPVLGPVGPEADKLGALMNGLWVSFIRTGKPQAAGAPAWPAYDLKTRNTMIFDQRSHLAPDLQKAERQLWADWEPVEGVARR